MPAALILIAVPVVALSGAACANAPGPRQTGPTTVSWPATSTPARTPTTVVQLDRLAAADQSTSGSRITSPLLKTSTGDELLLAFISADGPKGSTQRITNVTGGGLSWSLAARANPALGTAEVWQAYVTARVTIRVTAALLYSGYDGSIVLTSFTGAARTTAASATGGARTGPPSVTVTTTIPGSTVWAVGHDWDHAIHRTPNPGQALIHEYVDNRVHDTFWVQDTEATIPEAGTVVTMGDSHPTTDRWELAVVEISPT